MGGVCDKCDTSISVSRPDKVYYTGELINGRVSHEDCERHFDCGIADASILLKCYLMDTWDCGQQTFPAAAARARKYVLFESRTLLNKSGLDSDSSKETYTFNISIPENALPTVKLSSHASIFYNLVLNKPGRVPYCRKLPINVVPLVRLSTGPRSHEALFDVKSVKGSCKLDSALYSLPANIKLLAGLHCDQPGELLTKLVCRVETSSTRIKRTVLRCTAGLDEGNNQVTQSFCLSDMKMIPTFRSTLKRGLVSGLNVDYSVEFYFRPAGQDRASDRRLCSIGVVIENCSGGSRDK